MQVTPISTKLPIGDVDGVVAEEALLFRLDAQEYVQILDVFGDGHIRCPFRGFAAAGYGCGCEMWAPIETVDRAVGPDDGRSAAINVGGILAGVASLPSRMLLSHIEQALNTDKDQRQNTDNNTGPPRA